MSERGVFREETVRTFLQLCPESVRARDDITDGDVRIAWQLMFFVRKQYISNLLGGLSEECFVSPWIGRTDEVSIDPDILDHVATLLGFYVKRRVNPR